MPEAPIDAPVLSEGMADAMARLNAYIDENPTLDRFAESAEKLLEDTYSEIISPFGDRRAVVQIGEPINLAERRGSG